ncbi:transcriptional antiterminator NusG [Sinorhizobium fredii]|uniref:transcription termination/antitermination protein NusG n=1 Tax=Rhizobium fredii TaxID=380 RepID=UPI0035132AFB
MTMQRNVFTGTPIATDSGDRYADRMRRLSEEMLHAATLKAASDSPWYVLQVMTGREKAVEKALKDANVEALVPMRKGRQRRCRHRIIDGPVMPVMTGYLFVRCKYDLAAMAGLLAVEHVIGVLGGSDKPHPVSAEEVNQFNEKAVAGAYDWDSQSQGFRRGQKVRINAGPFAHFTGFIVSCRADGIGDAVVEVDAFNRMTPVLLPLAFLEAI